MFARKKFSTAPEKTAMLTCKLALPDSPHPVIIIVSKKSWISGTLSRWTEWIQFFCLINTKSVFLHFWLLASARKN